MPQLASLQCCDNGLSNIAIAYENIDAVRIEVRTTRAWQLTATDGSDFGDGNNGLATAGYLISGVTL